MGNGYEVTVKADTVPRTLRLYLSAGFGGGGKLKAFLSDGSAPVYVDTSLQTSENDFEFADAVYAITYSAASAGQTLTVRWTLNSITNLEDGGYIGLNAASLDGQPGVAIGPAIRQLSPTSGGLGTSVTISGTGFGASQGTSTVTFNGVVATPTSWSDTQIQVPAPATSNTGNVVVTVAGAASNPELFSMTPTITSVSPAAVPVGGTLTINGFNFGFSQGNSVVRVYGSYASVLSWSDSQIQIAVPAVPSYGCDDPVNCDTYTYLFTNAGYSNYANFTEIFPVQISPATAFVYAGQTQAFSVLIGGNPVSTPGSTVWSLVPGSVGTVDQNGVYTAPALIASQQSATVLGTVQTDSGPVICVGDDHARTPGWGERKSLDGATLYGGQTQQFAAVVTNANNTGVT